MDRRLRRPLVLRVVLPAPGANLGIRRAGCLFRPFVLVLAHSLGYQTVMPRDPIMRPLVGLPALGILAAQLWGRYRYANRARQAPIAPAQQ